MKWRYAFNGLIGTAALLLPLTAATDSRVETGASDTPVSARAQVNFKIVIPTVLYLHLDNASGGAGGAGTVAIVSNGHNVTLNASAEGANGRARGNLILTAAARKSISQTAQCRLADGGPAARRTICTVSTP